MCTDIPAKSIFYIYTAFATTVPDRKHISAFYTSIAHKMMMTISYNRLFQQLFAIKNGVRNEFDKSVYSIVYCIYVKLVFDASNEIRTQSRNAQSI